MKTTQFIIQNQCNTDVKLIITDVNNISLEIIPVIKMVRFLQVSVSSWLLLNPRSRHFSSLYGLLLSSLQHMSFIVIETQKQQHAEMQSMFTRTDVTN